VKKLLVVIIAVAVFVLLYFLTGQQKSAVDQQVKVLSSETDQSVSETSETNNSIENAQTESVSDSKQPRSSRKKLEPEIQQALEKMLNTSSEGLVEEKTDNGISVDLKGRFHTAPVATINEKGKVEVQDYNIAPKQVNE